MTAQTIYDIRDVHADFSGETMHALLDLLTGDPSPSGREPITLAAVGKVARDHAGTYVGEAAQMVLARLATR